MKRLFVTLLALVMVLSLAACTDKNSTRKTASSSSSDTVNSSKSELSSAEIEAIVVQALLKKIDSKYDTADPGSCRYSINKTEKKGTVYYVYGSVTLYDKYGKITTGWADGSGTAFRTFTIEIKETGDVQRCDID